MPVLTQQARHAAGTAGVAGAPVLDVQHIEKIYGSRSNVTHALRDVSFTVNQGDFVGIMGASGSGKSTLLNCVSTIDKVTSGSVIVNGEDVTRLKSQQLTKFRREQLGFIFQDSNLLDTLTARENIALPLTISRVPAKETLARVTEVAGRLGIRETLDKYPYQLSGGQQQRVAAARALVTNPAIIMADEPTGALDSKNARLLLESFETMNRTYRATVLMVTHDSFAASYTQRVLFIRDGRIFTELRRGGSTRQEFFDRIMEVVAMMGGEDQMLCKIALGNVRRASKDYLVYLLTLTLAVTVFYAFNTISLQVDIAGVTKQNAGMGETLGGLISGLTIFLGFVMGFLMVYANNFIMKRRKKEFGLYQVLGMSRGQVARIMALETFFVSLVSLVLGIILGVGLSQLMVFFTASLFKTQIADFHFFFSFGSFMLTVGCLVAIFLVTLVFNLRVVARTKIIDLMSASRRNENIKVRNPWISAVVFVVGAVLIGISYARLLRDGLPYDGGAGNMTNFLWTTIMVVIGTILFFFGLSGFLLKALQGARGMYWRGLNMVTMRQLAAKVNTVSFSMAMIAMILFLAITAVTAGMSLASVMNESVERGTPFDYTRVLVYFGPQAVAEENAYAEANGESTRYAVASEPIDMIEASKSDTVNEGAADARPFDLSQIAGGSVQVNVYDSTPRSADAPIVTLNQLCEETGMSMPSGVDATGTAELGLGVVRESEYNAYLRYRGMDEIDLGSDGYTIISDMGATLNDIYNAALAQGVEIDFNGHALHPVSDRVNENASAFQNAMFGMNTGTVVVPDAYVDEADLPLYMGYLMVDYADDITTEEGDAFIREHRTYAPITNDAGEIVAGWGSEATRTESYESVDSMNGLISYLAIYIGFVLVVACAAILTIQQLSGVADAGPNYRILSELGTPTSQIMHSTLVQQAIFFVFPLVIGIAHSCVALSVIIKLVQLFGGFAIGGAVGLTAVIFVVAYGGYFFVTYLMSKGIVGDAIRARHSL